MNSNQKSEEEKLKNDCAEIKAFLLNEDKSVEMLKLIERDIKEIYNQKALEGKIYFAEKDITISNNMKAMIEDFNDKKYTKGTIKIFRNFLEDTLKKYGFEPKFAQVTRDLSTNSFFNMLSQGYMFKDTFFKGGWHGEFTHGLQFLMICYAYNENKIDLNFSPGEIYRLIGRYKNKLFEDTFDQYDMSDKFQLLFTAPENITGFDRHNLLIKNNLLFLNHILLLNVSKFQFKISKNSTEEIPHHDIKHEEIQNKMKDQHSAKNQRYSINEEEEGILFPKKNKNK